MRFYTGKMFPEKYRNAAIVAEHGSWNRARKSGYRLMLAQIEGNRVTGYEPLVQGWLNKQTDQVSGRPVDVEVLDDGSLLVSDDYRGAVYRVTYRSPSASIVPGQALKRLAGFRAELGGQQSPDTYLLIRALFAGIPIVACLVALALLTRYPLSAERMRTIRSDLESRRGAV